MNRMHTRRGTQFGAERSWPVTQPGYIDRVLLYLLQSLQPTSHRTYKMVVALVVVVVVVIVAALVAVVIVMVQACLMDVSN